MVIVFDAERTKFPLESLQQSDSPSYPARRSKNASPPKTIMLLEFIKEQTTILAASRRSLSALKIYSARNVRFFTSNRKYWNANFMKRKLDIKTLKVLSTEISSKAICLNTLQSP